MIHVFKPITRSATRTGLGQQSDEATAKLERHTRIRRKVNGTDCLASFILYAYSIPDGMGFHEVEIRRLHTELMG